MASPTPAVEVDLDLDAERPSTFRLRGEVFGIRRVSPKRYAQALRQLDTIERAEEAKLEDIWEAQLDFIEVSVAPSNGDASLAGLERFRELRAMEFDGIEVRDIRPTYRFLQEVHTGRPTERPEDSSSGPGTSEASSKAAPGSAEVVRPS